ncbi:MAG: hypothetical protein ACLVI5_12950, partial [Desulfovibrio piger]|uniref:hypothetical protein n=1 Tax=Desulfovibrio piger TaxID=901 RepID=UPI00399BCCAB
MGYIFGRGEDAPPDTLPHPHGALSVLLGNRYALPFLLLPLLFLKEVRQALPDFRFPGKLPVGLKL